MRSVGERFALAVRQIIDRSVVSTEIVDILAAAGLATPDISILSKEFLAEVRQMEQKNLALEALRKLLNDEIKSRSRSNVVETRRFSDRLEQAVARYHTNAIGTVEVLQELIELARDIREARNRGEDEGLSPDEIAFYDALAENRSAVEVMGNDCLKLIAHELLTGLKSNVSVDWSRRESARARMRVLVKRILRKHGYPPDLQDAAVRTVLQHPGITVAVFVAFRPFEQQPTAGRPRLHCPARVRRGVHQLIDPVGEALSRLTQLRHRPVGGVALRHVRKPGMVDQPLGQRARQQQFAFGNCNECVSQSVKPEPGAALPGPSVRRSYTRSARILGPLPNHRYHSYAGKPCTYEIRSQWTPLGRDIHGNLLAAKRQTLYQCTEIDAISHTAYLFRRRVVSL